MASEHPNTLSGQLQFSLCGPVSAQRPSLPQSRVFFSCLHQQRNIPVRVLPEREGIFVSFFARAELPMSFAARARPT